MLPQVSEMGRPKKAAAPQWQSPIGFAVDANKAKANKMRAEYARMYVKVRDLAQLLSEIADCIDVEDDCTD